MSTNYENLKQLVIDKDYYINCDSSEKEEYTLQCFRHAVSDSALDLFYTSFEVIKDNNYILSSNEYFMFEFLITRGLDNEYKDKNSVLILAEFFTNPYLNYKENIYVNFELTFRERIIWFIDRGERYTPNLNFIFQNQSLLNFILKIDQENFITNFIFNNPHMTEIKKLLNLKNFD